MGVRRVWVRRPGASATLVPIKEDDLVDDVRDMILKKYANSLGRSFDAPDVTLRIGPRHLTPRASPSSDRVLGPEEPVCRLLDAYYPGGQTVEEALIIDVPRRTPRPSPRGLSQVQQLYDELRPSGVVGAGGDYFPPMPAVQSPHQVASVSSLAGGPVASSQLSHAMTILTTKQVPALPSPGTSRARHHNHPRPRAVRTHTSSPTLLTNPSLPGDGISRHRLYCFDAQMLMMDDLAPSIPPPPALPHSPIDGVHQVPSARVPTPKLNKVIRKGRKSGDHALLSAGVLEGAVPPINVLLVEDNIINLKLLEAFMKRLKVRWQTAMNGREAVTKWRTGGFHLVLMDIQLPVMNGLEATKEIRRLERINSIGVFTSSHHSSQAPPSSTRGGKEEEEDEEKRKEQKAEDRLENQERFKSPVIIVALTASSLQSDRHEALAAGCNDFLTKPVNYVWLERKVMEWGCMQALIDFDGWRQWKDFAGKSRNDGGGGNISNESKNHANNYHNKVGGGGGGGGEGSKKEKDGSGSGNGNVSSTGTANANATSGAGTGSGSGSGSGPSGNMSGVTGMETSTGNTSNSNKAIIAAGA